jgi:2-dehydro-3-deoxygluconokinase
MKWEPLIEDFMLQGGLDTQFVKWTDYDGCGRTVRNGLNFTERGFGIRAPKVFPIAEIQPHRN